MLYVNFLTALLISCYCLIHIILVDTQVLKAFHASVSDKLSKASSSHPSLKILSQQVQSFMNTLLSPQNYELLSDSLPARDLAFSLARIYMGMAILISQFIGDQILCTSRGPSLRHGHSTLNALIYRQD